MLKRTHSSPRILYFSVPWPNLAVRSANVAKALRQIGEVEIVFVDADSTSANPAQRPGNEFKAAYDLDVHPRPNARFSAKLRYVMDPRAPYPHGIGVDEEGNRRILETIRDFDLIWFLKLRTANMFSNWSWPRSVLDIDDLPSGLHRSIWQNSKGLKERIAAALQVFVWRRRERLLGSRFTTLAVCSEADKRSLAAQVPIHVIPNGFERPSREPDRKPVVPPRIGFIGLFDYLPNLEGVRWFIERCWPRIKHQLPQARLRLVGRGSDGPIKDSGLDIDGLGWVESADGEIATWSAMIVPVHIGGGTRVKIAEGFSRKCPIVSTRVGAYGYEVQHGQELLFADDPAEFAAACVSLVKEPAAGATMA